MTNKLINNLINLTIKNRDNHAFPYINLKYNDMSLWKYSYKGWVDDFNLRNIFDNSIIRLDLTKEKDLFLLFVLASCWSKNTRWENAVFFVTNFLLMDDFFIEDFSNSIFIDEKMNNRFTDCMNIQTKVKGINSRIKLSFKSDFYPSLKVLADNWNKIKYQLEYSEKTSDWETFINFMASIEGLGTGKKKMRIKIPLILRELRCQNIFNNIDGKYCCVADKRVRQAYCDYLKKSLPYNYLKASEVIWNDFGELYDIPPFAFEDLKELIL